MSNNELIDHVDMEGLYFIIRRPFKVKLFGVVMTIRFHFNGSNNELMELKGDIINSTILAQNNGIYITN